LLRKLDAVLDLDWLRRELRPLYSHGAPPATGTTTTDSALPGPFSPSGLKGYSLELYFFISWGSRGRSPLVA
jgi:hypothetical protein